LFCFGCICCFVMLFLLRFGCVSCCFVLLDTYHKALSE
jgi:hypothetical protein